MSRISGLRLILAGSLALLAGCRQFEMRDQPRYEPLEASEVFEDGRASRLPPEGVVAFGGFREDLPRVTGRSGGELVTELPAPVTTELLARGRERFNIFCAPCHDQAGSGQGMVVRRGFERRPPSFHLTRLREAPVGHYFDVITHGVGDMLGYAVEIPVNDRWAIVAYIRALQLSQAAPLATVPEEIRPALEAELE